MMMIACAVLGASAGCYEVYGPYVEESGESEEIVPPCSEADAGPGDAGADAAEDAPADAAAD